MRVLVVGAGAIGSYLGAYIARSGHWVTLVGREPMAAVVREKGLVVHMPDDDVWGTRQLSAVETIEEAIINNSSRRPYDAVLLCMKAFSVDTAIQQLQDAQEKDLSQSGSTLRDTVFVAFQNGIGSEEKLADAFGKERIVAATTTSPVSVVAPGVIRIERGGGSICLSAMDNGHRHREAIHSEASTITYPMATIDRLLDMFKHTSLDTRVYGDYRALKWSKLALNVLGNATAAILDYSAMQLYANARIFDYEIRMLREIDSIMLRQGIAPVNLPRFPAATLMSIVRLCPAQLLHFFLTERFTRGRGDKHPSFNVDLVSGKGQCEVRLLNGAVAEYGRVLGIATPVNTRLTQVLEGIVTGTYSRDEWRGQVDRLIDAGAAGQ